MSKRERLEKGDGEERDEAGKTKTKPRRIGVLRRRQLDRHKP